jgi:biofilm protein TabA
MIYDTLKNSSLYFPVHSEFRKVFKFISSHNIMRLPLGRHEIGRKGTFAIVQEYITKDESDGFIECHRKYIDIQYVSSGIEKAGISAKSACAEATKYDKDKDFQKLKGKVDYFTLEPSVFAIFFPDDGHMPCITAGKRKSKVRKIVFKIPG